ACPLGFERQDRRLVRCTCDLADLLRRRGYGPCDRHRPLSRRRGPSDRDQRADGTLREGVKRGESLAVIPLTRRRRRHFTLSPRDSSAKIPRPSNFTQWIPLPLRGEAPGEEALRRASGECGTPLKPRPSLS